MKGMKEKKMAVIKTEHLSHVYSGKSTLIQHLNGLLKPTSGKIYIDGQDMWEDKSKLRDIRFKVGLVFQYPEYQLFEETVYKDIAFGPKNMGLSEEEVDRRVRRAAAFVNVGKDLLDKSPFELSGGQKRRVAIAGVLAIDPKVLILDEPTAGLDPKGRDEILDSIKDLKEKTGITVILVSHSMEDVAKYVNRIMVMNDGVLMYDDTPKHIFAGYRELEQIGLAAPQVTYIMNDLKNAGFAVDVNAITVEEARQSILKNLQGIHGKA